jgi:hypothetical protein
MRGRDPMNPVANSQIAAQETAMMARWRRGRI